MSDERGDQANGQPTDGAREVGVAGRGGRCGRQRRGGGRAPGRFLCAAERPIRPPRRRAIGPAHVRGGMVTLGSARPAARARQTASASLPAARSRQPALPCGVNRHECRRSGCAGLGRPLGHGKNPHPGSRFEPRRGAAARSHATVGIGGGTRPWGGGRLGVRAEARGNGARAGAARARMPRRKGTTCPPPPCRRRRWRPTRPRTHR